MMLRMALAFAMGFAASASAGFLDTLQSEVLTPNGVSWNDLNLQANSMARVPFRLREVETLLQNPKQTQGIADLWHSRLSQGLTQPLNIDSLKIALQLWDTLDSTIDVSMPKGTRADTLTRQSQQIEGLLQGYAASLTASDWDVLRRVTYDLFVMRPEDTVLDAVTMEKRRLSEAKRSAKVFQLARQLKTANLSDAAGQVRKLEMAILDGFHLLGPKRGMLLARRLVRQAGLPLHQGTLADEIHTVRNGVWIDPGGNDTWELNGDGKPGHVLLILDLAGHDLYHSSDTLPSLPGFGGVMAIVDASGKDQYRDEGFGFASGVFGISSLLDVAGNDTYEGGCATQGFGFFGLGFLQDLAGADAYGASLFAQGAAATQGVGLLLDASGNDAYTLRPVFVDDLRYRDHFLSMGQGFATGFMLAEAGGVGILWDAAGHDTYVADIFAQGAGYWHALGLLLDDAGSDRYLAHQYVQGAGVHEAVGILWDQSGDDKHISKGVGQGCGHDRGLGLLFDGKGDDLYSATDMSLGAGSANGVGILYDAVGDDAYFARNPEMTLGHADMRRDRGSLGFFFDGAGQDSYPSGFSNAGSWQVYGRQGRGNGFGRDR
jgi:hypothetical protein